jgi:hypothetical protein
MFTWTNKEAGVDYSTEIASTNTEEEALQFSRDKRK